MVGQVWIEKIFGYAVFSFLFTHDDMVMQASVLEQLFGVVRFSGSNLNLRWPLYKPQI
jgi:hypothetical protein